MARVISEAAVRLVVEGSAAAQADARRAGERAGEAFAEGFSRDANDGLSDARGRFVADRSVDAAAGDAGERSGRSFSTRFARAMRGLAGRLLSQLDLRPMIAQAGRLAAILGALSIAQLASQAAIGGIVTLTAALAQLGGVVALIPAAYAVAGIAVGALSVATLGFGEALKSVGDPKKFAEAIEDLAPAARATAIAVRDLKPAFDELRLEAQQSLFAGLAERVQQLGARYLPIARSAFTAIAAAANQAAHDVANVLVDPARIADIARVAGISAESFRELSGAAGPLTQALIDIVAVGAEFFPGLVHGAGDLAARFAQFIATARESGALHDFISAALSAFGQLAQIIGNVGAIIGSVFSAANAVGGGLLGTLVSLTGELREMAAGAEAQAAMQAFFVGAAQAASALLPIIGGIVQVLGALGPILGQIGLMIAPVLGELGNVLSSTITSLGPVIVQVFREIVAAAQQLLPVIEPTFVLIGEAISALLPAMQPLVTAFSTLISVVAPLLPVIARLVAVVVAALAPALTTVAEAMIPVVEAFAAQLGPIITELTPIIQQLAAVVAQILVQALSLVLPVIAQLAPVFGQLAVTIGEALLTALDALAPVLPELIGAFLQLVVALAPLLPVIGQLVTAAAQFIVAIAPIIGVLAQVVGAFAQLVGFIAGPVAGILTRLIALSVNAQTFVIRAFVSLVGGVVNALAGMISGVGRAASSVTSAFSGLVGSVSSAIGSLISVVASIPGRISGAIGNLGSLLYNAGTAVIQGLINGIQAMLGRLGSVASSVASTIRDKLPFSPAKEGPLRTHPPDRAGRAIVTMLAAGLLRERGRLSAAVDELLEAAGITAGELAPTLAADGAGTLIITQSGSNDEPRPRPPNDDGDGGDGGDVTVNIYDADGVLLGTMRGVVADHNRSLRRRAGARR